MDTKEILSIPCVIVVIFSTSLITTAIMPHTLLAQTTPANLLTYQNSTFGIKIQYPSNWEKQENGTRQDTQTDIVTFLSPVINSRANLDVSIDDISGEKGISLTQYANQNIADLNQSLPDAKLIASNTNNVVIAGLPAYRMVYTSADGSTILKTMEIGAMKGDKVYILTYEAAMQEYAKYLPVIQRMIDSFQITK
jgi:eukaryotic-like serine/threonine-protein kinase